MSTGRGEGDERARDEERNSYCLASPAFPQYTAQVYRMCALLPLLLPRPPWRVETPLARMVSAVSCILKTTHPFSTSRPPRLVRQNEPDSVDLYERVKKKLTFSRFMIFTTFIKYRVYDYRSFRVSFLSVIINLFKKQHTHKRTVVTFQHKRKYF